MNGYGSVHEEKVLRTLESLGLLPFEAQVYVFLGKRGPQKARDIIKSLSVPKQLLYVTIKSLQSRGLITATLEHPATFSAIPFERVLDLFVKSKMEEVQRIERNKNDLLSDWQSIAPNASDEQTAKFSIIEGRKSIYSKLKQMIEETENQCLIITTVAGLVSAEKFGLLEAAFSQTAKTKAKFRFLVELTEGNSEALKLLLERTTGTTFNFEARTPQLGLKLASRMVIKDDGEAVFFISSEVRIAAKEEFEVCLWTNSRALVDSFKTVFEDFWQKSTDLKRRIDDIETGKPIANTCVISDPDAAKKEYVERINGAKEEVVVLTSSEGLIETLKDIARFRERAENGVSVKIMAPITSDNLGAALQLSAYCAVKHVPASHLRTTIIDNQHLFQFKNPTLVREGRNKTPSFDNAFYSNDLDYVEETRRMMEDVWENACAPSAVTLHEINKPIPPITVPLSEKEYITSRKDSPYQKMLITVKDKPGTTENDVLNKIINAKKTPVKDISKDIIRLFGSQATAVIHTPNSFSLPDMMLVFIHCNKPSSFGVEDRFQVHLWLETPKGYAFVPVAVIGDNPRSLEARKLYFAGTPASQNCRLLKKDELQIQTHGNIMFAGWTVPIPLLPPQYVLPPAGVLFEGYGKLKTGESVHDMPSGAKTIIEANGFDAFVTFFHPASKYAGPGTDGILIRDMVLTQYFPSAKSETRHP